MTLKPSQASLFLGTRTSDPQGSSRGERVTRGALSAGLPQASFSIYTREHSGKGQMVRDRRLESRSALPGICELHKEHAATLCKVVLHRFWSQTLFISCCPPCELCDLGASCFPSRTLIPLSVRESLRDLDSIKYGLSLVQGGPQPVVFVIPNTV